MTRAFTVLLLVIMVLPPMAQARQLAARADNAVGDGPVKELVLLVGRSAIIRTDRPIARVSLSTPDIADALVTTPYELLVHGKTPGTISLLIWSDNGRIQPYDVAVRRDLSPLAEQFRTLFPGEAITVAGNGRDVVLSGVVSSKYVVDRAAALAVGYVDKPENVVNLIRQQEGVATNQILLKVRFAEVSRSAVQELGASFFTGPNGDGRWTGRATTQQFAAPTFDRSNGLVFSDFLNLFAFNSEEQLGALIRALKTKGLFESLAEPNLITQDGKEASFLAGGEYPYPVLQGTGANSGVTITFKEFGVRLKFTPTVTGDDLIQLKVTPEVSTLDFANAITLQGFRVPALSTRRTDTQVELRDGQTFAIAGLLDRTVNETLSRVPGIGDIPILGYLFKSQAYQKNATELVVMITPHIVRRNSPGVTPNLPGLVQPFLPDAGQRIAPPPPPFITPLTEQQAQPATPVARVPARAATTSAVAPAAAPEPPANTQAPPPTTVDSKTAVKLEQATKAQREQDRVQREQLMAANRQADQQHKREAEQARIAALAEAKRADEQKRLEAEQARVAALAEARRAEQQKKQDAELARAEQERSRAAAKVAAEQAAKDLKEQERARKADAEQQQAEQKLAVKQAAEQAAIDRKRWTEQQAEAARLKEQSDKLAKEQERQRKAQEKLAEEQAAREAELSRLVEQYKKLMATAPAASTAQ
jgi:pilus assembly protein CpaC